MYPIPEWAARALRGDHGVAARAHASINGSSFSVPLTLAPSGNTVKVGSGFVRRECTLNVVADVTDPEVSPYAAEILVEYGVIAGLQEWWQPVGTFMVTRAAEAQTQGVVVLSGSDRGRRIIDARLELPVTTSGSIVSAIESLVTGADSRITFTDHTGSTATHAESLWERDRADAVQRLAASIGAVLYFYPDGSAHLHDQPSALAFETPVWSFGRGLGGGKVESARTVDREGVYNAYVAIGEGVDGAPGVSAVARDTNPASATLWGGPFGKRPRFLRSSLIETVEQATRAAEAGLARSIGQAWSIDLSGLPNPALEVGDPIMVEVAPGEWSVHHLDGYTLPLAPGAVAYETRASAATTEDGEE